MALPVLFDVHFALPNPLPVPPEPLVSFVRLHLRPPATRIARVWVQYQPTNGQWCKAGSLRPEEQASAEQIATAVCCCVAFHRKGLQAAALERSGEPSRYRVVLLDDAGAQHLRVLGSIPTGGA